MRKIAYFVFVIYLGFFCGINLVNAALTDNGDGTVTDTDTGLMWLKESFPRTGSPETAKTWKDAMLWANSLAFAGYNDWRLPSALEATTGVPDLLWNSTNNEWGHLYGAEWGNPANSAEIAPMSNYPCCWYWTSTEDPSNSARSTAFFVSYDNLWLNDFHAKITQMRYTAVRGAPKPTIAPQCRDGYDNDGNGLVDYPNDQGCSNSEDNKEFTCTGFQGFIHCGSAAVQYQNRWWCFKIDDSTICIDRIYTIAGIIIISAFGFWWFRRRKKTD